jgi:hypothetical protein
MWTTHLHLKPRLRMSGDVPRLSPTPSWHNEGKLHLFHCMSRVSAYNRRRVSRMSISEAAAYNPDYRRSINGRDRDAFFQGETLSQQPATHAPHSADMQEYYTQTPYRQQERHYGTDCKTRHIVVNGKCLGHALLAYDAGNLNLSQCPALYPTRHDFQVFAFIDI